MSGFRRLLLSQSLSERKSLNETSWEEIATIFKTRTRTDVKNKIGWNVGDTKTIVSKSGKQYTVRIVDMNPNRYAYSDKSGYTKVVFDFVECVTLNGNYKFKMNSTRKEGNYNGGGFKLSDIRNIYLPEILSDLPDDMQSSISEVDVLSGIGSGATSGTSVSSNKLFLPSETEIDFSTTFSIGREENPSVGEIEYFDYYKHHSDNAKIKKSIENDTAITWWLRSPCFRNFTAFCAINVNGKSTITEADVDCGISPFFTI